MSPAPALTPPHRLGIERRGKENGMRLVRTILMAAGMAALAACGGADDPAPEQPGTSQPAQPAADEPSGPPAAFVQCVSCHSVKPGVHGVGPSLHGIFGAKAASVPGFAYSTPLREAGLTWDEPTLDKWLAGTMQMVPGTRMIFPGMPDPARRKAVIDYLATLQ
jgi:cytochrome c